MKDSVNYPSKFYICSGKGESEYKLVAFDNALLDAGISNYNLLQVSSILPKQCMQVNKVDLEEGMPLLTAFANISSTTPGDLISTSIGIGVPADRSQVGVIMEHSGHESAEQSEKTVTKMVKEAMTNHGIEVGSILVSSTEATVSTKAISLISAVAFW